MNLYVICATIIVWNILEQVDAKFYLEKMESADIPGDSDRDGTYGPTWALYECCETGRTIAKNLEVKCHAFQTQFEKDDVYTVVNFNGVLGLELITGYTMVIGSTEFTKKMLGEVLTVGVEARHYSMPNFRGTYTNTVHVRVKMTKHLTRFVNFDDKAATADLNLHLSVNNIAYFKKWTADSSNLFASYAKVLQKVIDAFRQNQEKEPNESTNPSFKKKFPRTPKPANNFESQPKSRSFYRILSQMLTEMQTRSKSLSKYPKILSQRLSWSRSPSHSRSPSPSPPRPLSPRYFLSEDQQKLKTDLIDATNYLALKMFDPCFVLDSRDEEIAQAESVCGIYCKFLSMAMKVHEKVISGSCTDLETGRCVSKMCVCEKSLSPISLETVKIVYCNDRLRLHFYAEGSL